MLQSIRDHTQGWIAGIIVSLLILSFALWGIHSYLTTNPSNAVVAEVNGVDITQNQLAVAYERLRRQLQMQFTANYQLPEQEEASVKARALQALINIEVLKQASIAEKYRISLRQIDSFLQGMPEFQVNGRFSMTRFQRLLETTLYNANDFLELIRTSLLIDQPRLGLIFSSFALPNEIVNTIALVNQERSIRYALIPVDNGNQTISLDKVTAYYKEHAEEFKTPEQVSIEYIQLSLKSLMNDLHPNDEALKKFYTENSNLYTKPAEWRLSGLLIPVAANASSQDIEQAEAQANDVYKRMTAGQDKTALERQYPLDKTNKKLFQNWVTLNQVSQELQKSVLSLNKTTPVAEPVRTRDGFVIMVAKEFKEPVVQAFNQVKDKVKESLIRQQAEETFSTLRDKLASMTYEHPDSLVPAAKSLGLSVQSTELFTKEKGGSDITAITKIREAGFSNEVLDLKNNSEVIQATPDVVVVIRLKTHVPPTLLAMQAVEKQIRNKLQAAEAENRTAELANRIKNKLELGANLTQITQEYHLTWKDVGFIGRHSNKVDSAILVQAFMMPKPKAAARYDITKMPNGYAVIALQAVRDGQMNGEREQYQVFAEQIQNTQGLLEYELYKESLIRQAKIKMH